MRNYYYKGKSNDIEFVYAKDSKRSYRVRNHAAKYIIGMVLEGRLALKTTQGENICEENDLFIVAINEKHAISALEGEYTLLNLCVRQKFFQNISQTEMSDVVKQLADKLKEDGIINEEQLDAYCEAMEAVYCHESGLESDDLEDRNSEEYLTNPVHLGKYYDIHHLIKQWRENKLTFIESKHCS